MKSALQTLVPPVNCSIGCPIAGFGLVRGTVEQIKAWRQNPVPCPGEPIAPSFLKHADEQTVAAMASVYQAIHNHGLSGNNFSEWGVVAAPSFLGRAATAQSLYRFQIEGAWGISPQVIPHHSLHAVSGTISQALNLHGPNFGIGGYPGAVVEALLAAATMLSTRSLPGLWLVLSEYEQEYIPVDPRLATNPADIKQPPACLALALAMVPHPADSMGLALHICPQEDPGSESAPLPWTTWTPLVSLAPLIEAFSQNGLPMGQWRLGANGWVKLTGLKAGLESRL